MNLFISFIHLENTTSENTLWFTPRKPFVFLPNPFNSIAICEWCRYTRAGGAAQRVFELMDSLPDIDPNAGKHIKKGDVVGDVVIEDLSFAYQSRCNHSQCTFSALKTASLLL